MTLTTRATLSPTNWPAEARAHAEQIESRRWAPDKARVVTSKDGAISTTVSPIAVEAGLEALRQGGNAVDAAVTMALAQITTQLGSVVSFAGILTMLHYEAKTGKLTSLDAGWNSYKNETDPKSIPFSDMGPGRSRHVPTVGGSKGRATLVPGFMAGIEAMHQRFGNLSFKDLFAPAIHYAENGLRLAPILAGFFKMRESVLARSPEGRRFMYWSGGDRLPQAGDNFVQPELAETLRGVAENGARYMYTGPWGRAFVEAVQKEGGKATLEDLANYRVIWSEPYKADIFGHTVCVSGEPSTAVYQVLGGLKLTEALNLHRHGPHWSDPVTLRDLSRIGEFVAMAPNFVPAVTNALKAKDIDFSRDAQKSNALAAAVAPVLGELFAASPSDDPKHSNSIVVVDKDGDIVVMTHTINTIVWGDTGIVVGGIPLPDPAGFQQDLLSRLTPGDRLPHLIACTLTFEGSHPVLATAPVGSFLVQETIKTILSVIGQKQDLATVVAAPPLLINYANLNLPLSNWPVTVPSEGYDPKLLDEVKALGVNVDAMPVADTGGSRGTLATMLFDPATGEASTPEVPGIMVFAGGIGTTH